MSAKTASITIIFDEGKASHITRAIHAIASAIPGVVEVSTRDESPSDMYIARARIQAEVLQAIRGVFQ